MREPLGVLQGLRADVLALELREWQPEGGEPVQVAGCHGEGPGGRFPGSPGEGAAAGVRGCVQELGEFPNVPAHSVIRLIE